MAVNEKTGVIVQVSEGGYTGMLNVARKSMKLYFMRDTASRRRFAAFMQQQPASANPQAGPPPSGQPGMQGRAPSGPPPQNNPIQVIEVDLAKLFADSGVADNCKCPSFSDFTF